MPGCGSQLGEALLLLEQLSESLDTLDSYGNSQQHTFPLGVVPDSLQQSAEGLEVRFSQLYSLLMELRNKHTLTAYLTANRHRVYLVVHI